MFGKNTYATILLILFTLFALILLRKYIQDKNPNKKESFVQEPPFIVKRNENIYDEFFSKVHDKIFHPEKEQYYDVMNVFKMTEPTQEYSVILDIGCGTGNLLNTMYEKGFTNVFGLDKSVEMGRECLMKNQNAKIKIGCALTPMMYEKSTFTHIFCIDMTIYEIKDRITFFRNCYYWLKSNCHLILHLVDRQQFNTIVPAGIPKLLSYTNDDNNNTNINMNDFSKERITNTEIDFGNFKYNSSYDFSKKNTVVFTETFVDANSSKIRKNEKELFMEDNKDDILFDAQYCGFIVVGQTSMKKDKNQYIFVLERPH
jgi:2-polyprenyl-3-methyl-5-hydroxy-6-metoxy-1,4-benzoquinol methylase